MQYWIFFRRAFRACGNTYGVEEIRLLCDSRCIDCPYRTPILTDLCDSFETVEIVSAILAFFGPAVVVEIAAGEVYYRIARRRRRTDKPAVQFVTATVRLSCRW